MLPSFNDSAIFEENLGELGKRIRVMREFKERLRKVGYNYAQLGELIDTTTRSEERGDTPWSKVSNIIYARFLTEGSFGEIGYLQVRVLSTGPGREINSVNKQKEVLDIVSLLANPNNKDILEIDEIQEISSVFTSMLKREDLPSSQNLGFGEDGRKYDGLIGLWTKYWNDIFNPEEKLSPNIVKALMATESGFQPMPKNAPKGHKAIGIMQLMPETVNIASAVRWLFRKREIGEHRLKKKLTWMEVLEEYKGITGDTSPVAVKIRNSLKTYYTKLLGNK